MKFLDLVAQISQFDNAARLAAGRSLRQILSLRNWVIGASIVEFEQAGEDRAAYGTRLIPRLAKALAEAGCRGLSRSNLKNYRQVALAYPGLDPARLASPMVLSLPLIGQTSSQSGGPSAIRQTSGESPVPFPSLARRAAEQENLRWRDAEWLARLFAELTFSHILELSRIEEQFRRWLHEERARIEQLHDEPEEPDKDNGEND